MFRRPTPGLAAGGKREASAPQAGALGSRRRLHTGFFFFFLFADPLVVSLSPPHCSTKDTRETLNEPAPRKSLKVVRGQEKGEEAHLLGLRGPTEILVSSKYSSLPFAEKSFHLIVVLIIFLIKKTHFAVSVTLAAFKVE